MSEPITKAPGTSVPLTDAAYEKYADALHRYLETRVRRPEDIADLSQEIFELFLRRFRRPEALHNPLGYLFRIAFHVLSDTFDRKSRDPVMCDSELADLHSSRGFGTKESAEQAEELAVQEDVLAALATLPANYMTALMLVEGEGMSYQEAAEASGFSHTTIATYVMRGRAALKRALDDMKKAKDPVK